MDLSCHGNWYTYLLVRKNVGICFALLFSQYGSMTLLVCDKCDTYVYCSSIVQVINIQRVPCKNRNNAPSIGPWMLMIILSMTMRSEMWPPTTTGKGYCGVLMELQAHLNGTPPNII